MRFKCRLDVFTLRGAFFLFFLYIKLTGVTSDDPLIFMFSFSFTFYLHVVITDTVLVSNYFSARLTVKCCVLKKHCVAKRKNDYYYFAKHWAKRGYCTTKLWHRSF